MKRIYLASRYDHRMLLCGYREELRAMGYDVTSRWLDGFHTASVGLDDKSNAAAPQMTRELMAQEDWADLLSADICVSFTEPPDTDSRRGGRHVEFGGALATGKRCIVVGYRENVFHCLPAVEFYDVWDDARIALAKGQP